MSRFINDLVFDGGFKVTQEFGVNKEYYSKFNLQGHEGLDIIPLKESWKFKSLPYKGIVVKDIDMADKGGVYGNCITIWYPEIKEAWQYCHNRENYFSLNQEVPPASYVATMGNTGNTTGAHIHINRFQVDINGKRLNKNNGFLGGVDPLIKLIQLTDNPPVIEPQKEDMKAVKHFNVKSEDELIEMVEKELGFLKAERAKNDKLSKQLENLELEVAGHEQKIVDLAVENNQLEKQVAGYKGEVTKHKSTISNLEKLLDEAKKSPSGELNQTDVNKWVRNMAIFAVPVLITQLGALADRIPEQAAWATIALFLINTLIDLGKKFVAGQGSFFAVKKD